MKSERNFLSNSHNFSKYLPRIEQIPLRKPNAQKNSWKLKSNSVTKLINQEIFDSPSRPFVLYGFYQLYENWPDKVPLSRSCLMEKGLAEPNLGRSRGQENVIIVDTDKDSSSSTFFSQTLAFMEHNKIEVFLLLS